jgi:1-phosphofructokinase family hexose kinase
MDIITLTLNPCIDRTIWLDACGAPTGLVSEQTGGKGVNVARALSRFGVAAAAVCPVGGEAGDRFLALAADEGINVIPVQIAGETRRIDTYVNENDYSQAVERQIGPALTIEELTDIETTVFGALKGAKALVISGGASCETAAIYAGHIMHRAKQMGIPTLLDSNGDALLYGARAVPDIIKPNREELTALTGEADISKAARIALDMGIGEVLVSLGAEGCAYFSHELELYSPAYKVDCINPVGSGDCFVAAYIYATLAGFTIPAALEFANAAGAANARVFPAARIEKADIDELFNRRRNG